MVNLLFFKLLFLLALWVGELKIWQLLKPWTFIFWTLPVFFCVAYAPTHLTWYTFFGFNIGFMVFCQDLKTRYFSRIWLFAAFWILIQGSFFLLPFWQRIVGLAVGLLSLLLVHQKSLGLADAIGLGCIGFSLGLEGLGNVVMLACLSCLIYGFLSQERLLPFLSFLAWAYCLIAYWYP